MNLNTFEKIINEAFDVKEKMEEVSWEELIDEYEDGEITVEEYNIN